MADVDDAVGLVGGGDVHLDPDVRVELFPVRVVVVDVELVRVRWIEGIIGALVLFLPLPTVQGTFSNVSERLSLYHLRVKDLREPVKSVPSIQAPTLADRTWRSGCGEHGNAPVAASWAVGRVP